MNITFLGTGTSTGIPEIACQCPVCRSTDTKDKRLRSSILVESKGVSLLIDCGQDFRQQTLRLGSPTIDAVLITHEHADHTAGIDELRPYCRTERLPLYAESDVCDKLRQRIPYCFREKINPLLPNIELREIDLQPFDVLGIPIVPIRLNHGTLPIVGFRVGKMMAYLTDFLSIDDAEYSKLEGLDLLIMGALRHEPHPSHQTIADAINQTKRIRPQRTLLTHIAHSLGFHHEENAKLPKGVALAYDGLFLTI